MSKQQVIERDFERTAWLTVSEISQALSVPMGTVYYWVSRNEIPYLKVGRHLRFNLAEVVKYFQSRHESKKIRWTPPADRVEDNSSSLKTRRAKSYRSSY